MNSETGRLVLVLSLVTVGFEAAVSMNISILVLPKLNVMQKNVGLQLGEGWKYSVFSILTNSQRIGIHFAFSSGHTKTTYRRYQGLFRCTQQTSPKSLHGLHSIPISWSNNRIHFPRIAAANIGASRSASKTAG